MWERSLEPGGLHNWSQRDLTTIPIVLVRGIVRHLTSGGRLQCRMKLHVSDSVELRPQQILLQGGRSSMCHRDAVLS